MNIKNTLRIFLNLILLATGVPFLLGFVNEIHPLFDSYSHFRVHLLLVILPLLILLSFFYKKRRAFIYLLLVTIGSFYLYYITQPFKATPIDKKRTHQLKHLQFNLNFRNQRMVEFKEYLRDTKPDVVTMQEVTPLHKKALEELKADIYPYQIYCKFQTVGGVAILSKHPFNKENAICMEGKGLVWSQILVDKYPINIVSIHTYWPFPYSQPEQIQTIKEVFKEIKGSTLIAGDFNAAAWSHSVKEIESVSHTEVVKGMRWSITLQKQFSSIPNFKLAIDHVLLSKEFQVEEIFVEKGLGSDHSPIVSKIWY